jgi:dTDP-4-dehydrorhamnose reductase
MLGRAAVGRLAAAHDVVAAGHGELDVTDTVSVRQWFEHDRYDWVVHLAALTNVDRCQREPDRAMAINAAATETLAAACAAAGSGLLLLSSIAVFDGAKPTPYVESDLPRPANVYGESKWRAERAVASLPRHLIVRTGWLFAGGPGDHKFIGQILRRAREHDTVDVVADRFGSPTFVGDLAEGLSRLLREAHGGLVHLVNEGGPVSRVDVAREAFRLAGVSAQIRPVPSAAFPTLAPRPAMEAARSERVEGWLRTWAEALRAAMARPADEAAREREGGSGES